jgi:hypothetical protein
MTKTYFFFPFFHYHYSPLGLSPVEKYSAIFSYLSPALSIFSLLALQVPFLPLLGQKVLLL